MKEGFDVVWKCPVQGSALNDMIANMKHGGNISSAGSPETRQWVLTGKPSFWNSLNIRGIYGRKVWDTYKKMTTMLEADLDISANITPQNEHQRDYKKGFDAMISGQSGRSNP